MVLRSSRGGSLHVPDEQHVLERLEPAATSVMLFLTLSHARPRHFFSLVYEHMCTWKISSCAQATGANARSSMRLDGTVIWGLSYFMLRRSKLTLSIWTSICFLLKGWDLGRGIWGSPIFPSNTCNDGARVERFYELQECQIDTTYLSQRFGGVLSIICISFSLRAAWFLFLCYLVMPILIIFTGAHVKQVIVGKRA